MIWEKKWRFCNNCENIHDHNYKILDEKMAEYCCLKCNIRETAKYYYIRKKA